MNEQTYVYFFESHWMVSDNGQLIRIPGNPDTRADALRLWSDHLGYTDAFRKERESEEIAKMGC